MKVEIKREDSVRLTDAGKEIPVGEYVSSNECLLARALKRIFPELPDKEISARSWGCVVSSKNYVFTDPQMGVEIRNSYDEAGKKINQPFKPFAVELRPVKSGEVVFTTTYPISDKAAKKWRGEK